MQTVHLQLEELETRNLLSVFTPAQIRHAYGFDQLSFANGRVHADGSGQTIAIVEAFHDPKIASDLHYFDWIFGLPDPSRRSILEKALAVFEKSKYGRMPASSADFALLEETIKELKL